MTSLKRDQKAFTFIKIIALIPLGTQRRSLYGILHQTVIKTRGIRTCLWGKKNPIHCRTWNQSVMFTWSVWGKKDFKVNATEILSEFSNIAIIT